MCTYPVQPICTFSCTSVYINIINPQYTVFHILFHCTSYSLFYFIICSYFHSHLYLYIFLLCYVSLFYCFFIFLHFPLSGPVLTYISLLIIPCMIVYVTNYKEPWTLVWMSDIRFSIQGKGIEICISKHIGALFTPHLILICFNRTFRTICTQSFCR